MNGYNKVNVFISGGAGVIGSSLIRRLYLAGARLFVGDLKPRPKDWPAEILYREGDLNEIKKEDLVNFQPTIYFHLAATFERSVETYPFWEENFHNNIRLSHYLIDCLKECKSLRKVIFASSYLIYDPALYLFENPSHQAVQLGEKSSIFPRNLCGMAKLLHEKELTFIAQFNRRLTATSARIFRSYGRDSRDIISRWIRALLKGEEISVFAQEGIFDFIFADDVAEGLIRLGLLDTSDVTNLGSGRGRKISEVLNILRKYFPKMRIKEEKSSIPFEASQADMEKFQSLTGWTPSHQLEDTIPLLIEHERQL